MMKTNESSKPLRRLGYWMSDKKNRKFIQTDFPKMCRSFGMELIQIDLSSPLENQGPFDAILHKLTDIIVKADAFENIEVEEKEASECRNMINAFEKYVLNHPEVCIIDPLDNVRMLLNRLKTYKLIKESHLAKKGTIFTPPFAELDESNEEKNLATLRNAGINFPFICKPSLAHGSRLAHQMAIIFNERGIKDITPPCVAQSFVCHNAVLYKLFAVGNNWFQVERPSLKNFYAEDHETIFFDSQDVSKAKADSSLNQLDQDDLNKPISKPSHTVFENIMKTVREILGMALFGVDVVIENSTGKYAIIDINAFPGYDGVPDFHKILLTYINEEISKREMPINELCLFPDDKINSIYNSHEDSGIDTGDSSDEKHSIIGILSRLKLHRRQHPHNLQQSHN